MTNPKIRFAVTGINHGHIYDMTHCMLETGAEAVSFFATSAARRVVALHEIPEVRIL